MEEKNDAGEFSIWVGDFIHAMRGIGGGVVPCGECVACCTSSKFIHIRPTDVESLKVIPKEILFSAPRLPKGHYLLGYKENGECPMFQKGKCTIYEFRPETCKQYDCRVLAATRVSAREESPGVTEQINRWEFRYSTQESKETQKAVIDAMSFLKDNATIFPKGYLPDSESQLAAMAVRIHEEFIGCSIESGSKVMMLVNAVTSKYKNG